MNANLASLRVPMQSSPLLRTFVQCLLFDAVVKAIAPQALSK